jgi:hypothetical protein
LISSRRRTSDEIFRQLWDQEPILSLVLLVLGGLYSLGLLVAGPLLGLVPLLAIDDGSPSGGQLALAVIVSLSLLIGTVLLIRRRRPWLSFIRRQLSRVPDGPEGDELDYELVEDDLDEIPEDDFSNWDAIKFRVRRMAAKPLGLLAPPMDSSGGNFAAWPIFAVVVSGLVSLWLPNLHLHHDYFVAVAQVIPVLMVAIFVEATALFRVYMPVILRVFQNRSGAPTPPQFFAFRRYMKNMLWLAVVGEIAVLTALAADSDSTFLGALAGISTLVVGLALSSTFFERLQLDQFLRTRTPGSWNDTGEGNQGESESE